MAELDSFFNTPRGADPSSFYSGISALAQLTAAQKAMADAMIAGTFDKIGAPPAYMQPNQSVDEM